MFSLVILLKLTLKVLFVLLSRLKVLFVLFSESTSFTKDASLRMIYLGSPNLFGDIEGSL